MSRLSRSRLGEYNYDPPIPCGKTTPYLFLLMFSRRRYRNFDGDNHLVPFKQHVDLATTLERCFQRRAEALLLAHFLDQRLQVTMLGAALAGAVDGALEDTARRSAAGVGPSPASSPGEGTEGVGFTGAGAQGGEVEGVSRDTFFAVLSTVCGCRSLRSGVSSDLSMDDERERTSSSRPQ